MNNDRWFEKSSKNLTSLSTSTHFEQASSEWEFTGDVIDHGAPSQMCELCEQEALRYHYGIENSSTQEALWVGSSCILKFAGINVCDENGERLVVETDRKRILDKKLKEKKNHIMLDPVRKLYVKRKGDQDVIHERVKFFKRKGGFMPRDLVSLFEGIESIGEEYKPELFPVYLRSRKSQRQIKSMRRDSLRRIANSLSAQQKIRFAAVLANV